MNLIFRAGFVIIAISYSSLTLAQETAFHGKALFTYPNQHPVYIVTYTQQDLQKMKRDQLLQDISKATFTRKVPVRALPMLED